MAALEDELVDPCLSGTPIEKTRAPGCRGRWGTTCDCPQQQTRQLGRQSGTFWQTTNLIEWKKSTQNEAPEDLASHDARTFARKGYVRP